MNDKMLAAAAAAAGIAALALAGYGMWFVSQHQPKAENPVTAIAPLAVDPPGAPPRAEPRVPEPPQAGPSRTVVQTALTGAPLRVEPVVAAQCAGLQGRGTPFPAGDADVHVLSLYEAPVPGGPRHSGLHAEGVAEVIVARIDKPVVLFLYGHEPVDWRVRIEAGTLRRVVAVGEHPPRVTVMGEQAPDIVAQTSSGFCASAGVAVQGFPTSAQGAAATRVAEVVLALFGKLPASFQSQHNVRKTFTVDAASPPFVVPQATSSAR